MPCIFLSVKILLFKLTTSWLYIYMTSTILNDENDQIFDESSSFYFGFISKVTDKEAGICSNPENFELPKKKTDFSIIKFKVDNLRSTPRSPLPLPLSLLLLELYGSRTVGFNRLGGLAEAVTAALQVSYHWSIVCDWDPGLGRGR